MGRGRGVWGFVVLLLGVMLFEIAWSAHRESVSWDEGDHLFAGFMSLRTGDFGLNPEHPPLAKMVAAAPLVGLPLKVPKLEGRFFKDEAYFDGKAMIFGNSPQYSADTLMFRARMAMTIFAVSMALLVFLAGREMFGVEVGLFALLLVVFEPNILTHAPFVATDSAVTCLFFATVYATYRYVKGPTVVRLATAGIAAGLALGAKHSAVVLLPTLLLLLTGEWVIRRRSETRSGARTAIWLLGSLAVVAAIGVSVLWAFYGFRYAARPSPLRLDPTLAQYVAPLRPLEAHGILLLARFHILPESWLYGLADVRSVANAMPTYLFGKVYAHGIWGYFPAVLLIKLTLGTLGLFALAVWALFARGTKLGTRETWFLLAPAGVYLWVAMGSQLNIGVRHVLPVLPFLVLFSAAGAWELVRTNRRWVWPVGVLVAAHVASSAWAFPNYLPYANEAWGGSGKTYRYLSDSNADWGQQLHTVSAYLKGRGITDCSFAYFVAPFIDPKDYGIPCRLLPTSDTSGEVELPVAPVVSGVVLISAGDVNGFEFGTKVRNPYQSFMTRTPDAVLDGGVLVFHGTFAIPLAAAIAPTQESARLLKAGDAAGAVAEAQHAVKIARDGGEPSFDALLQLGKAERALGNAAAAQDAFGQALWLVGEMEPSAQGQWRPVVEKERAGR